jgi:septal ring factor EnvC (AmiA/AmiB activator)
MDVMTTLMIIGVATVAGETVLRVARARAGGATQVQAHVDQLEQRLEDQASTLAELQSDLAGQEAQFRELQDRLDFAERLLTQAEARSALNPGPRGGVEGAPGTDK